VNPTTSIDPVKDDDDRARPANRAAQLIEALRAHAGVRHVVVIRGYPDPDSLASGWAHAQLAHALGIECDIAHLPVVSRPENRAMVNILELPLVRLSGPEDLERYAALSLVDAHAIELPYRAGLPCVSIVDHHSVSGTVEAEFVDVRTDVGATSTIYTEYLFDGPVNLLDQGAATTKLATALAYGIRSDTDDLLRATEADFHALSRLITFVDAEVLAGLARFSIGATAMRIMRRALEAMEVQGTWAIAGVGQVRPQDRDAIGQAADFLVRREGIKNAVVFGLVEGWIDGSLRTIDPSIDPASWLRDAFGIGPLGLPYGGGRRGKGGFQIPLGPIATCPNQRALWRVVKDMVEDTIMRRVGPSEAEEEADDRLIRTARRSTYEAERLPVRPGAPR
jgi:nanoRNase/pAp phosphatase (c-di-AMP/oligoRNAs hydrolase)